MEKVLCLDIGGSSIKSGVVDRNGNILKEGRYILKEKTYKGFLDTVKTILEESGANISGIVTALPGGYDIKNDTIFAPNLQILNGRHIKTDLESLYGIKVTAENDANLAAYGEYVFGEKKSIDNMVFCTLGTGFGGGLILNRRLLQSNITLFEAGHMSIDIRGRQCGCGRKGCVDEYCSTPGLMEIWKNISRSEKSETPYTLKARADKKEESAVKTFEEFGKLLANVFANMTALFCPDKIKFGGGLSELSSYYIQPLLEEYEKIVFPAYKSRVKIEPAVLKNQAGMLGGAALYFEI